MGTMRPELVRDSSAGFPNLEAGLLLLFLATAISSCGQISDIDSALCLSLFQVMRSLLPPILAGIIGIYGLVREIDQ
jgi:hypothetical protein